MDKRFFEVPNSINAYWAGFIMADGSLSDNCNLQISLKDTEKDHLIKFCSDCNHDVSRIKYYSQIQKKV